MYAAPTEEWKVTPFIFHMFNRKGFRGGAEAAPYPWLEREYRLNDGKKALEGGPGRHICRPYRSMEGCPI